MGIDYKKEVDSGLDRKRIVESNITALLREGIPTDIITKSPNFNFRHFEMVRNLEKGYEKKEEQILEIYGGYSKEISEQIVPDRYSKVSHPVGGELYPMTKEEEIEKFKERDKCIIEIEKAQQKEIKKIEKERNKIIKAIAKYKTKFNVIDKIIETITELEELQERNTGKILKIEEYTAIFNKNGLTPKKIQKYDKIYSDYKELTNYLSEINIKYENALNGKINTEEISILTSKKNVIETEIIQRNTKLVNGFIRQKYGNLLVETDELFQICYIAMWKAAKEFDYKNGFKFSTFAYKYMDQEIKHNFKELTGYRWEAYWTKKKITVLLENTSKLLGRKVSIEELVYYGFLDMSEKSARGYLGIVEEHLLSDLYQIDKNNSNINIEDNEFAQFFDDKEIDEYEIGEVDYLAVNSDPQVFRNLLKEEITNALSTLTEREKLVITLRFGLNDGRARTLEEVAKTFDVSRERIRQVEAKALRKLRHPFRSKRLIDYLDEDYQEEQYGIKIR